MNTVGQPERATQNRVIALFRDELGYRYLGDWTDRDGNSNIEEGILSAWLTKSGNTAAQIAVALHKLRTEANNHSRTLYGNNQAVYNLLRYGVPVKIEAGKVTETVHLINWREPEVPWKQIAGMRDKVIHDYFGVNLEIVWAVVQKELPKLRVAIVRLLKDS